VPAVRADRAGAADSRPCHRRPD